MDHLKSLLVKPDHIRNNLRRLLKIDIDSDHHFSSAMPDSRHQRLLLSKVSRKMQYSQKWINGFECFKHHSRSIPAAIIDDDYFEVIVGYVEVLDGFHKRQDSRFFIEARCYHRNQSPMVIPFLMLGPPMVLCPKCFEFGHRRIDLWHFVFHHSSSIFFIEGSRYSRTSCLIVSEFSHFLVNTLEYTVYPMSTTRIIDQIPYLIQPTS